MSLYTKMLVVKKQMLDLSMGMHPKLSSLTKDLVWPLRGKNQPVWIHVNQECQEIQI